MTAQGGVPLLWTGDEAGYQCPHCSLYVATPLAAWRVCPRCPPIPLDEAMTIRLLDAGFDEDEAQLAVETLEGLIDALARIAGAAAR